MPRLDLRRPNVRRVARETCAQDLPWLLLGREGKAETCNVEVHSTPCRFGGSRPWFRCPRCGRRVLTLYWHPEGWRPGCRQCLRLTYPSQRASRDVLTTGQLRVQSLWRRVDPNWTYGDEDPSKPPRMRWQTWERVCKAVAQCENWINEQWLPRVGTRLRAWGGQ